MSGYRVVHIPENVIDYVSGRHVPELSWFDRPRALANMAISICN